MKKIFFFLIFLFPFIHAQISDYNATNPYYWDNIFAIDGNVIAANPATTICDFYIYDLNNRLVQRLDSQYATASGRFSSAPVVLRNPPFERGNTYIAKTYCGPSSAQMDFNIYNRKNFGEALLFDWDFILQPDNVIVIGMIILLGLGILAIYNFTRSK